MVLSQGNEKGKLEACRGSVFGQECTSLHRAGYLAGGAECVPLCIHTSAGIAVTSPQMNAKRSSCARIHLGEVRAPATSMATHTHGTCVRGWVWMRLHAGHPRP